jgi:hypothetical protein
MRDPFIRFAGIAALLAGGFSILYAVVFLVIAPRTEYGGTLLAWIILAVSGALSGAVYVALFQRTRIVSEGLALWGMLIGTAASGATMANGIYQALLVSASQTADEASRRAAETAMLLPSEVDPKGLSTFLVFGIASFVFGWLMLRVGMAAAQTPRRRASDVPPLPRNIGYAGMANAVLLMLLFLSFVFGIQPLVLLSGGLSSVVVTPLWWIWIARSLLGEEGRS